MIGDEFCILRAECYVIYMSSKFDSYQKDASGLLIFCDFKYFFGLIYGGDLGIGIIKSRVVANHLKGDCIDFFLKDTVEKTQIEALKTSLMKENLPEM